MSVPKISFNRQQEEEGIKYCEGALRYLNKGVEEFIALKNADQRVPELGIRIVGGGEFPNQKKFMSACSMAKKLITQLIKSIKRGSADNNLFVQQYKESERLIKLAIKILNLLVTTYARSFQEVANPPYAHELRGIEEKYMQPVLGHMLLAGSSLSRR